MKPLTIIETRIDGEQYVATTPHMPTLSATSVSEADAVGELIAQVRSAITSADPVTWIAEPKKTGGKDVITRKISGLWPLKITTTKTPPRIAAEEHSDGN